MRSDLTLAASALVAAVIAGVVALLTTLITQKNQKKQIEYREKAERVAQFSHSLSSVLYSFLWITWCAKQDNFLDGPTLKQYWEDMRTTMPKLYGGYVVLAHLDKKLAASALPLLQEAESLDVEIGKAAPDSSKQSIERLSKLYKRVEQFSDRVKAGLAGALDSSG